jgi:RNA polymerase sigma factor (sigma-70 family)
MAAKPPSPILSTEAMFDGLLVTLVLGGDRVAGDRLAARWHPRLLRTARRLTGDSDAARQAAQESWLAIWRGLPSLREPSRFAPWAFGILRRKCVDALRQTAAARSRSSEVEVDALETASAPDDALAIRQAFSTLSPDHRLAAHLHFVEGLTLAEIAEVQAVPIGTAKSRLFHARRQLKLALGDDTTGDTQ